MGMDIWMELFIHYASTRPTKASIQTCENNIFRLLYDTNIVNKATRKRHIIVIRRVSHSKSQKNQETYILLKQKHALI